MSKLDSGPEHFFAYRSIIAQLENLVAHPVSLAKLRVTIARREVLYLFDAYCTLLRAASTASEDQEWLAQVEKNGGIIVSIDGIQPDKGNDRADFPRTNNDMERSIRALC